MSDCQGKPRNNCNKNCLYANGAKLKYCRKRTGKKCRGKDIDICYEEGKCKVAQGNTRRFCRKTFNKRSLSKSRKSKSKSFF